MDAQMDARSTFDGGVLVSVGELSQNSIESLVVGFGTPSGSSSVTAWASTTVAGNPHYGLGLRRALSGMSPTMHSWSNNVRLGDRMSFSISPSATNEIRAALPGVGGIMQMHARL